MEELYNAMNSIMVSQENIDSLRQVLSIECENTNGSDPEVRAKALITVTKAILEGVSIKLDDARGQVDRFIADHAKDIR